MVAEENDFLSLLDRRFHHGGDGFHLRMDSHPATKLPHGLELALDHGLGWLGELWHHASQSLSHHIEVSPAHMEARVVGGLNRIGSIVLRQTERAVNPQYEEWDCTTALLTLQLRSKTLFLAYTTRRGSEIKPCEESVPIEAFLYGPALPLDLAKVVFSGTPLPEYRTFPSPIMYQSGSSFTMKSAELYNLIKQEKIIPLTDGVAPLDELTLSAQAEIEKFLRRIQGEPEAALDDPVPESRPGPEEPDERIRARVGCFAEVGFLSGGHHELY